MRTLNDHTTTGYEKSEESTIENNVIAGCYVQVLTFDGEPQVKFNTQNTATTEFCTFAEICICRRKYDASANKFVPCVIGDGSKPNTHAPECMCGTSICGATTGMHCLYDATNNYRGTCGFG